MKKILVILLFLFIQNTASATYIPNYLNSVSNWGIGAIVAPREFSLYESADENSKKVLEVKWAQDGDLLCNGKTCESNPFVAYVPNKNYAILAVYEEYGEWAEVYYGKGDKRLFLKLNENTKFYTWGQFMLVYGKKHGLYVFKDVKKDKRLLYAAPDNEAQVVDNYEIAKFITPWFVRGNFVMVKLINWDNKQKTGYLRWRDTDGRLWGFAKLTD